MVIAGQVRKIATPRVMAPHASLTVAATTHTPIINIGQAHLTAQSSLSVAGRVQKIAVVKMTAHTSLTSAARLVIHGTAALSARTRLIVTSAITPSLSVTMSARASLVVFPEPGPVTLPSLEDQLLSVLDQDPIFVGATGYLDPVFTTRLVGDTE
jgi:hypothetical protein